MAGLPPPFQLGFDPVMYGRNISLARAALFASVKPVLPGIAVDSLIAGITKLRRAAIAIDDEARIVLLDKRGAERVRQAAPEPGDADIPGDVALQFRRDETEPAERARHQIAGMIGDQEERRCRIGVVSRHRPRLVRGQ